MQQRREDDDAAVIVAGVQHLLREATSLAAALAERSGLSPSDASALKALDLLSGGPRTAGELGAALELSSAAVTGLIDRLEAAGLGRRVPHPSDRRRVHVELTETARRFGAEMLRPVQRRIQAAIDEASPQELAAAARFLRRLTSEPDGARRPGTAR